jgi:DNA-binding IclR family transcriptional regulator
MLGVPGRSEFTGTECRVKAKETESKPDYRIEVVLRALRVLELLARLGQPVGAGDVATHLGISRNTAFRLLATLKSRGYVTQDEDSRKYRLGLELFHLGNAVSGSKDIRRLALPFLEQLRDAYQETANLVLLHQNTVMYIERLESPHSLRISTEVGTRYPLHCTALGKAILSHLPTEKVKTLLGPAPFRRLTENTLVDYEQLLPELEEARRQGYALDRAERSAGVVCVGAAFLGAEGKPVGAVSLAGPFHRMEGYLAEGKIKESVRAAAEEMSRCLEHVEDLV